MTVQIACPNPECDSTYTVADENLGKLGRCKTCGEEFSLVPGTRVEVEFSTLQGELEPVSAEADSVLPESFGRYKVVQLLGRGGMGRVYLALDTQLNRQVALKVPHLHAFADRPEVRKRFFVEAQAAARFHHPNFCPIHDIGEAEGVPYLTMAFITGKTLAELIEYNQGWPLMRAAEVIRELSLALAKAHREGIIHRDLKPANIMIDDDGRIVLMDFGLARWYDLDSSFTPNGAILGTPAYMSPEQAEGNLKAVGPRSDLYALGVILYELLTGRRPFEGPITKVLGMIAFFDPLPPSKHRPNLDPRLEAICLKSIAKNPDDRYVSMEGLAEALNAFLSEPTIKTSTDQVTSVGLEKVLHSQIESNPELDTASPYIAVFNKADHLPNAVSEIPHAPTPTVETFITNTIGMKLRLIPAGEFLMGSADDDLEAQDDERPRHLVKITRSFYLSIHAVTQAEFHEVMGINPSWFSEIGGGKQIVNRIDTSRFPVESISWLDAVSFCNKLSEREGLNPCHGSVNEVLASGTGYRLPTEAEWEYACRAGTLGAYSYGNLLYPTEANFDGNETYSSSKKSPSLARTAPVDSYLPNALGLFCMHGNVWEWCQDWYSAGYYEKSPTNDPVNCFRTQARVFRGGSWDDIPNRCRSACRFCSMPIDRNSNLGFRVARMR